MKLIFMDEALDDIEYICEFLVEAGERKTDDIRYRIISSTGRLMDFPKLGVKVHQSCEWGDVRDFFSGHYCLRYAFYKGVIYILRVWHQKENERNL